VAKHLEGFKPTFETTITYNASVQEEVQKIARIQAHALNSLSLSLSLSLSFQKQPTIRQRAAGKKRQVKS